MNAVKVSLVSSGHALRIISVLVDCFGSQMSFLYFSYGELIELGWYKVLQSINEFYIDEIKIFGLFQRFPPGKCAQKPHSSGHLLRDSRIDLGFVRATGPAD